MVVKADHLRLVKGWCNSVRTLGKSVLNFRPVVRAHMLITLVVGVMTVAVAFLGFDSKSLLYPCSVVYALLIVWIVWSWKQTSGSVLSAYLLFVLAAAFFNGGQLLLECIGMNSNGVLGGRFSDETLIRTATFCVLSLACLHLGAMLAARRRPSRCVIPTNLGALDDTALKLGLVCCTLSIVPSVLMFRASLYTVMSTGYFSLYQRETTTGLNAFQAVLSDLLLPAAFILAAGCSKRRAARSLSLVLIAAYCLLNLFLGYRGMATAALSAYAWVWHTRVKHLPVMASIIAGLVLVLCALPMIGAHREARGAARLDLSSFIRSLDSYDNPAVASITEIGGTMSTVAYTIQLVPATKDFELGQSYVFALLTALPNVFGTSVHPSIQHGTPSAWLVNAVDLKGANAGGGLGYSFIAESYLNFGWFGPLTLIVLGWAVSRLEVWSCERQSAISSAVVAICIYYGLIYARAETANIVRGLVWYAAIPYALVLLSSRKARRHITSPGRLKYHRDSPVQL